MDAVTFIINEFCVALTLLSLKSLTSQITCFAIKLARFTSVWDHHQQNKDKDLPL